jgi:hypothetical protein
MHSQLGHYVACPYLTVFPFFDTISFFSFCLLFLFDRYHPTCFAYLCAFLFPRCTVSAYVGILVQR